MSIYGRRDLKKCYLYTHNTHTHKHTVILFRLKKRNPAISNNNDEMEGHYGQMKQARHRWTPQIHFYVESEKAELIKSERKMEVAKAWEVRKMLVKGYRDSVMWDEEILSI